MQKSIQKNGILLQKIKYCQCISNQIHYIQAKKQTITADQKQQKSQIKNITKKISHHKQIQKLRSQFQRVKSQIVQSFLQSNCSPLLLYDLNIDFTQQLVWIIDKNRYLKKKIESNLVKKIIAQFNIKKLNVKLQIKKNGVQDGFIINDIKKGLKLFVKNSKIYQYKNHVPDPRQIIAYKLLEKLNLGPPTKFFTSLEVSRSSKIGIHHIVTVGAQCSSQQNVSRIFKTDDFQENQQDNIQILDHWQRSLKNSEFRIKLIVLSIVNDLLHLNDTLASNSGNYGSVQIKQKQFESCYNPIIIDHQIRDSLFKFQPNKNPIVSLIEKLNAHSTAFRNVQGQLISYKIIRDNKLFTNPQQLKEELYFAIQTLKNSFQGAFKYAIDEIDPLIQKNKQLVSQISREGLQHYLEQTYGNFKQFIKMSNTYLLVTQQLSKKVLKILNQDLSYQQEGQTMWQKISKKFNS